MMKFIAEMGHWSSVVGNSVHLIGEDGRFLGQIAIMCQDDRLREKDVQTVICEKICSALNADLCASGQQVRALMDAARELIDGAATTYRARNGRQISIEADDGERCYIVHSDLMHALEAALTPAPQPEGLRFSPEYQAIFDEAKARAPQPEGKVQLLSEAIRQACDLLAERTHGSPARSPAHNARLVLEAALRALEGRDDG